MQSHSFAKVLIANRGEIACRVIRTARALGYQTVAVYSDADRDAPHVGLADEAVRLGPPEVGQSYLDINKLITATQAAGAGAIHPGYGFLSENVEFAQACRDNNIVFVGPDPDAIALMGNKRAAKLAMQEAGVPCVPGYEGEDQSNDTLSQAAQKIGFPVMVKATAGGGGRGMRLVESAADLEEALNSARSEAKSAFGSDELILEKAIVRPRHVEIQVFGDRHGNVIHLGERDCSVQRRHQKIIEESPSPAVDADLRRQMGESAVAAAKACDYVGAGTVEFIVDPDGNYYFLEMNTRLQVEHPVTECVTGVDLVEWQLAVAAGEPLPLQQDQIELRGHAIEVRLYAEDPDNGFLPQTGRVQRWAPADVAGLRVDAGITEGLDVTAHYDPMLAKFILYAPTRNEACRRLQAALAQSTVLGVTTNRDYLCRILRHPVFVAGEATTQFVAAEMADQSPVALDPLAAWGLPALAFYLRDSAQGDGDYLGWRSAGRIPTLFKLGDDAQAAWVAIERVAHDRNRARPQLAIVVAESSDALFDPDAQDAFAVWLHEWSPQQLRYADGDGVVKTLEFALDGDDGWFAVGTGNRRIQNRTHLPAGMAGGGTGELTAPLDGAVIDVRVQPGDRVQAGDILALIEAMKMEHQIKADVAGSVETVRVQVGDQVKSRQELIRIQPDEAGDTSS